MATSNTSNVTLPPFNNCPGFKSAFVPDYWKNGTNDLGCAAPICSNNEAVIAKCCNPDSQDPANGPNPIHTFDTDDGPYVYCVLNTTDRNNDTSNSYLDWEQIYPAYQEYQNCILRENGGPFKCSRGPHWQNSDYCYNSFSVLSAPVVPDVGTEICGIGTVPNISRTLIGCCDDEPIAYGDGCFQYCRRSNTTSEARGQTLVECIRAGANGISFACPVNNSKTQGADSNANDTGSGTDTNSTGSSNSSPRTLDQRGLREMLLVSTLLTVVVSSCAMMAF